MRAPMWQSAGQLFCPSGEMTSVSSCSHCHFNEQIVPCAVVHIAKAKKPMWETVLRRHRSRCRFNAWLPDTIALNPAPDLSIMTENKEVL
jgi:hypothetical protein